MTITLTAEQASALDAIRQTSRLKIIAGPGSGKTETLYQAARHLPRHERALYTAFNNEIVTSGRRKFGRTARCATTHQLAYAALAAEYEWRLANGPKRQRAAEKAILLRLTEPLQVGGIRIPPAMQARLAADGVATFSNSADTELTWAHVPSLPALSSAANHMLRKELATCAQHIWNELTLTDAENGGRFELSPGHIRKMWQLSRPRLPFEVILLDEAQDTAEVVMEVLRQQDARQILIGDPFQAINEWAGAIDALKDFAAPTVRLSRSFRFGVEIAAEVNKWLRLLGSTTRITGTGHAQIGPLHRPTAVLTRTNGGAAEQVLRAQVDGLPTALAGRDTARKILQLAAAADDLRAGRRPTWHPELIGFATWSELRDYADTESGGGDLRPLVRIIDDYGTSIVRQSMTKLVPERHASRVVTTMHRAKGLEWDSVLTGPDVREPVDNSGNPVPPSLQEARLAYVATSRARRHLDRGGLAYVDKHLAEPSTLVESV